MAIKPNQKQMYELLMQQVKAARAELNPDQATGQVNVIPENFNQIGWDTTIEAVRTMLEKMIQLREVKGKLLTPQFFRSIYNRCLIADGEIDRLYDKITMDSDSIDFDAEVIRLNGELFQLNQQLAPIRAKAAAKEKAEAEARLAEIRQKEADELAALKNGKAKPDKSGEITE